MANPSIAHLAVKKVSGTKVADADDSLAAEEPLEIRLSYGPMNARQQKSISVTMRTPGNDAELAIGFLYTEGIIGSAKEITSAKPYNQRAENIIRVELDPNVKTDMERLGRHFYTSSSCGVCGKASIDAVKTVCNILPTKDSIQIPVELIYKLPALLRDKQDVFEHTGGLHASALFDLEGKLLMLREDVGRHNALDKLIGASLMADMIPLDNHILLLSGRASFELIQKAAMAGIKIIAAVGAPSSLAVEMADESDITLIGFLRGERFNIYTGAQRIVIL